MSNTTGDIVSPDYRPLDPGMGFAVAKRTILRKRKDRENGYETWGDVADRVALGNSLLVPPLPISESGVFDEFTQEAEQRKLRHHIAKATLLMSGRHLQHGDENQPSRVQEIFTNCFDGDTEIATLEYGSVKFRNIVGETVTVRCKDGVWRPALVSSHGNQDVYEYKFASRTGTTDHYTNTAIATENHRWFLSDGKITTNLKVGDRIVSPVLETTQDPDGVVHGLIFGDGTAHKSRIDTTRRVSQGRTYASIRVSNKDSVKDQVWDIFDKAGYHYTTPPHADGDRVYYLGKLGHAKELPFTTDPEYIAGFIQGWWLADGYKSDLPGVKIISTSNPGAVEWLKSYASYAGYIVAAVRCQERTDGDGSFANGKPLYTVRLRENAERKVVSKQLHSTAVPVYCVSEPVTQSFTLANGLVTGNCSTAASTFTLFYLLLNGSGVGRCYDDDMILVDWDHAPNLICVLDDSHKDFDYSAHTSVRDAKHKYGDGKHIMWFKVPDSREGWAQALEIWETAAHEKVHSHKMLILDFSDVRCSGSPIGGMQDRPASGPVPLMNAFNKAATLKGAGIAPWKQALYMDHYFAECVLVGGARRAARMSTKFWKDESIFEFVQIKRPIEYHGKSVDEVMEMRKDREEKGLFPFMSFLWSANNSVCVDAEYWRLLATKKGTPEYMTDDAIHARKVHRMLTACSYGDGTGEPGLINVDKLKRNDSKMQNLLHGNYVGSKKYQIREETQSYLSRLARRAKRKKYNMIVNPCAEIVLLLLGGFCVIADVVPFYADSIEEAEDAFRAATRALMRVNTMDSIYKTEVDRTNRIGVGMTGVHEFAWKFFGYDFNDLIDEEKSKDFWLTLARFNRAVRDEAERYAKILGVEVPHTVTTVKPSGTISKLFGLSEGWHLPSMKFYMRNVQFRTDDPLVEEYKSMGYPVRELKSYEGTSIVGFPTAPTLSQVMPADRIVTAGQASPEDQYKWLMLGEKYWIHGTDAEGNPHPTDLGNQISYTLKYDPDVIDHKHFKDMLTEYQSRIRCCSVMPQTKGTSSYEYLPEQSMTKADYQEYMKKINNELAEEDVSFEHVDCAGGACPVDFK